MKLAEDIDWKAVSTLEQRRDTIDVVNTFKILKGGFVTNVWNCFKKAESVHGTRGHTLKMIKPRHRTNVRGHFLANRIVDKWNRLDEETVSSDKISKFKNDLRKARPTH